MSAYKKLVGGRIAELRKKKGLSQSKLAETLNVEQTSVSRWETGRSLIDKDNLNLLCDFFTVTPEFVTDPSQAPIQQGSGFEYITSASMFIIEEFKKENIDIFKMPANALGLFVGQIAQMKAKIDGLTAEIESLKSKAQTVQISSQKNPRLERIMRLLENVDSVRLFAIEKIVTGDLELPQAKASPKKKSR